MGEHKAFKDAFDAGLVARISEQLTRVEPRFEQERFRREAVAGIDALELMARVGLIADALQRALPGPTAARMRALIDSLPPVESSGEGITAHGAWLWPYGEFVARHGLDDVEASFSGMLELTQRFTSEFAVRPFLARDVDGLLDRLEPLCAHPSEHVRRWVSEGTRTRLPWGRRVPALEARLERRLRILARLRRDPSRYVQRSVANHLGDVLKQDRPRGLDLLEAWIAEDHPVTNWIVRHAARHALKQADPRALALLGQSANPQLELMAFKVDTVRVRAGDSITIGVGVRNGGSVAASLRLDYRLDSPGAGTRRRSHCFRYADVRLEPGESTQLTRCHRFVDRSIRPLRCGPHRLVLMLNGVEVAVADLEVMAPT